MTLFNWKAFSDKEFVALIHNGGIVAGYDNDFSRAMVEEAARRIEYAAQLEAERDEARLALDGLRQHHSKIIMALYEIDHDVFGPLTSIEGIAELKRQRDELARQLEQATQRVEELEAPLKLKSWYQARISGDRRELSEWEAETPFGQALDGMGDEVES
jgi:hypothetical protein